MTYREFNVEYDRHEKTASTLYHKYIPKKVAKLLAYPLYISGITPNSISSLSFLFLLLSIGSLYYFGGLLGVLIFFVLSLLSYSLDCVDGVLARITNQSSDFGGFYDLFLDRLGEIVLYYFLFYYVVSTDVAVNYYLISACLVTMFFYSIVSILRSFRLRKLDGTMKSPGSGIVSMSVRFFYEFIDTGTFYFFLAIAIALDLIDVLIMFYGFISFILTFGVLLFSYKNR